MVPVCMPTGRNFCYVFFFFRQKTAYEFPKRDLSSDVCSSDLIAGLRGVDHGDDRAELEIALERAVGVERLRYRPRVGEAARLDDDAVEAGDLAAAAAHRRADQGLLEVAAQVAAQAAVGQRHGPFLGDLQEVMV